MNEVAVLLNYGVKCNEIINLDYYAILNILMYVI